MSGSTVLGGDGSAVSSSDKGTVVNDGTGSGVITEGPISIIYDGDGSGTYTTTTTSIILDGNGGGNYSNTTSMESIINNGDGSGQFSKGTVTIINNGDGTGSYTDDKLTIQNNGDSTATVNGATVKDNPKVEKVGKLGKFPPVESLKPVESCGTVITLEDGVLFDFGKSDAPKDSDKSDASGTFTVDESNAHVEIPAGTKTVVINGSNNHIEGKAVSEITINGSANAVEVKSASKVSFTGSNNAVQYEDGNAPQVGSDSGANNVVSKDN